MTTSNYSVPVGSAILGRMLNARGESIDGLEPLTNTDHTPVTTLTPTNTDAKPSEILETGIKVVDLLAPIVRGGIVSLRGDYGVGKMVLMQEIIYNAAVQSNACAILISMEERPHEIRETYLQFRASGHDGSVVTVCAQPDDPPMVRTDALRTGITMAEYFRDHDHRDVLVIVDERVLDEETKSMFGWVGSTANGTITAINLDQEEYDMIPYDTRIVMNRPLFEKAIYPAVDPLTSGSRLLDEELVDVSHMDVSRQVRTLVGPIVEQKYDDIVDNAWRTHFFCTQPFFVAQMFTGIPGEFVPLTETIKGIQNLLDKQHNEPNEAFYLVGTFEQALEKGVEMAQTT